MRVGPGLALLILTQGCGEDRDAQVNSQMLNRIAFQHNEARDLGASARLQPTTAVAAPPDHAGLACRFTHGEALLVQAFGAGASARVNGALRAFRAEGPVGPTGGFFRDRELALSIGVQSGAPARARVTNRSTGAREDHEGQWQCAQASR